MGSNANQIQKTTVISVVNKMVAFAIQAVMLHSGEQLCVFTIKGKQDDPIH